MQLHGSRVGLEEVQGENRRISSPPQTYSEEEAELYPAPDHRSRDHQQVRRSRLSQTFEVRQAREYFHDQPLLHTGHKVGHQGAQVQMS